MEMLVFVIWIALAIPAIVLVTAVVNLVFNRFVTPRVIARIARKHNVDQEHVKAAWQRLDQSVRR